MPVDHSGFWSPPTTVHPTELHAPFPPGYTHHGSIPAPTTQTPRELVERLYFARRNEPDWTDPNGALNLQVESHQKYPQNAIFPIGSSGLVATWPRPDGLAAVPVPVCGEGMTSNRRQVVIEFKNWDRGRPSKGISLTDILTMNNMDDFRGTGDILEKIKGKVLDFIISWPGYQPERSTIRTVSSNGGPLTRFDLGQQLAIAYARFFGKVEKERMMPREVGFFNIALHQGLHSRSDSLGVQLTQLHLVQFRSTIGGSWVADIEIV